MSLATPFVVVRISLSDSPFAKDSVAFTDRPIVRSETRKRYRWSIQAILTLLKKRQNIPSSSADRSTVSKFSANAAEMTGSAIRRRNSKLVEIIHG